jgi:hypothetical protein
MLALSGLIFATACKKDATKTSQDASAATLSDSSTVADNAYNDVFVNAFYGYVDEMSYSASNGLHHGGTATNSTEVNTPAHWSCAQYTLATAQGGGYPITLTLDFGTDGCSSSIDGVLRKGKIIYVFSGPFLQPGTTVSASFDQYYVNGYGLQGTCSITNNSTENGLSFSSQITNGIFTFPDLTNFHYSGNKTVVMTGGASTPFDPTDDVYSITGNSNFSASDGSSLVSNITSALVKKFNCPYISAGVISFTFDQVTKGTIDFGDGTCDHTATLVVGSINATINLR